jgi:hypothetical protein
VACVHISPAFNEQPEFVFSVERYYGGKTIVYAQWPKEQSVYEQIKILKRTHWTATIPEIASMISVESLVLDNDKCSLAKAIADRFELLKFSAVPGDTLFADATSYSIRVVSLSGELAEFDLTGPGPAAKTQPEPLLDWAEHTRRSLGVARGPACDAPLTLPK